jgi:predicted unusual protein kinase regulating ubiquinone biosynthesis (AarF/ABC1/UbiB family)
MDGALVGAAPGEVHEASRPSLRGSGRLPLSLYAVGRTGRLLVLSFFFLPQLAFRRRDAPVVLRRYLQACGGGFVKLGQILAMRYDLLPVEYCDELGKLLDQVSPLPLSTIERVISEDLGRPVPACFTSFEATPIGSASIAQVHAAELITGEAVAVKVIRPGIVRTLRVDLAYLGLMGSLTSSFGILSRLNLEAMTREVTKLMREELDFHREARNVDLFHRLMAEDEVDHYAPRVYFTLSGPRVITMERIEGVRMTDLMAAVQRRDQVQLRQWAERGIRPRRTARLLLRSILEQTMRHRVFHADPHAANLIVRDGGALAWVDFGMVGWLDEHTWGQQFRLQAAIANEQIDTAVEALLASLAPLPVMDLTGFELEARAIIRDWIVSSEDSHATMLEKSTARLFMRLFAAIRKAGLTVPADLMRVYRTVIGCDVILLRLDRDIDWVPELREFVEQESGRQLLQALRPRASVATATAAMQAWLRFFSTTFNLVNWLDVRLPEMTRSYQREFSRFEQAARLVLRYARILVLLFVVVVLLAHIPQLQFDVLASLDQRTGPHLPAIVVGGFLTLVLLSRMLGELKAR